MATNERKKLKTYRGTVSSISGDKTVKVLLDYMVKHPKYGKRLKRTTVAHVHDELNTAKIGDTVDIAKCRPMSKTKFWRLVRVIEG